MSASARSEALEQAAREALRLLIVERADEDIRRYGGSGISGLEKELSGYRLAVEDLLKAALSYAPESGYPPSNEAMEPGAPGRGAPGREARRKAEHIAEEQQHRALPEDPRPFPSRLRSRI